jgi:MYXO-CTERM domain-containing protein
VLIDIHAPQDAPAGVYKGVVNVTGGVTAQIPVELTVWDFAVPSTSTLKTAFGLNWNAPCAGHGDSSGPCSAPADMALRARYVQAALDNHISIHQPWHTGTVDSGGVADWADFDAYVGPLLAGTANTRLPGARLTAVSVNGGWASPMVSGWASHFKDKGWSSTIFAYICDEPPATCQWGDINPRISSTHAGSLSVKTLVTTSIQSAQQNKILGLDLVVPVIDQMENRPGQPYAGNQRAKYPANIWWYQSCDSFGCVGGTATGWPTMAIDADATRNRAMEWMSFSYNVQGELYYETAMAYYLGDPWVTQAAFGGNGDGTLFYPGTTARIGGLTEIPVESLRMKAIRDGMEDYELLAMATTLGMGAQATALSRSVFPVTYQATATPEIIDTARGELAALILHALGKELPAPDGGTGNSADAGTAADAGSGSPDAGNDADAGSAAHSSVAVSSIGSGCSSGPQSAWMWLPLLALAIGRLRRRVLPA